MSVCCTVRAADAQVFVDGGGSFTNAVRKGGSDVPLLRALEEIVPPSYSVMVPNAGSWADTPVSWHAGTAAHALGEILSFNPSLQAHVDTDLHIVTVTADARHARPVESAAAQFAPANVLPPAKADAASAALPAPAAVPPLLATAPAPASNADTPKAQPAPAVATTTLAIAPAPAPTPTPAPADPPAAPAQPPEQMQWQLLTSDGSVRNALARWAGQAGWQFIWDVPTDFVVDATATIHGTLADALRQVTEALAGSQVPIQVVLYERNRVMRVVAKGASR